MVSLIFHAKIYLSGLGALETLGSRWDLSATSSLRINIVLPVWQSPFPFRMAADVGTRIICAGLSRKKPTEASRDTLCMLPKTSIILF